MSELCFTSAVELAAMVRTRRVSVAEVVAAHLAQVERIDPQVNAVVTFLPERAMAAAREADARLARGEAPGPLFGLPVAHKDLVPTKGVRTTWGSPIYRDHVPDVDAVLVERIAAAGAICIGKTNTPEFGAGSQTFNAVFGATGNPYDPTRTCGGSSGGAAAALACGMVPIADGSDLGGSLRNPASFCNVVGLRPSTGRVPGWPNVSGWFPLSVEGPMARTVADTALLLSVMAGPDARAPLSLPEPGARFAAPLGRDFRGCRVGWVETPDIPVDAEVRGTLERQIPTLAALGCSVEPVQPDFHGADFVFKTLRAWRFALGFGPLLAKHRGQMKETVIWNIEEGLKLGGSDLARAERERTEFYHRFRALMERFDFLALPAAQVPPFPVTQEYVTEINGIAMPTYLDWMRACTFITVTGLPAISVPAGFTGSGLPVGMQIVGRHLDDFGVLQIAHAFEQATRFGERRPALAR
jgi:amidase